MRILSSLTTVSGQFTAVAADSGHDLELSIYDYIDADAWLFGGVSASMIDNVLNAAGDVSSISLRINSPGGDVDDGIAIYNRLKNHPAHVTVHIDGMAASAASIVAMAGDEIIMGTGSMMMIHEPSFSIMGGDAETLRDYADVLDVYTSNLLDIYEARTGLDRDVIAEMVSDETWMTADDAIAHGFATGKSASVIDGEPARAKAWREADTKPTAAKVAAMCARYAGERQHSDRPEGAGEKPMFGKKKKDDAQAAVTPPAEPSAAEDIVQPPSVTVEAMQAMNDIAGPLATPLMLAGITTVEAATPLMAAIEAAVQATEDRAAELEAENAELKASLATTQASLTAAINADTTEAVETPVDGGVVDYATAVETIRNDTKLNRGQKLEAIGKLINKKGGA